MTSWEQAYDEVKDLTPEQLEARWLHRAITSDKARRRRHVWLLIVVGVPVLAFGLVMLAMILEVL